MQVGLSCAVAQVVLSTVFLKRWCGLGPGPWHEMPGFTAHQIITIPVLLYLAIEGLRLQLTQDTMTSSSSSSSSNSSSMAAVDRLTESRHLHLSEFVFGMMVFWDIPTGLCTKALREAPMVFHHFAMAAVAALALGAFSPDGQPIVGYYAPFFFGVIEWSSLPLIIVDIFHPKHKAWHAYLTQSNKPSTTTTTTTPPPPPPPPEWLHTVNAVARMVFAVLFLLLRTVWFPYVSVFGVLADVWSVRDLPLNQRRGVSNLPLVTMAILNVLFSCLQMYWGCLLMQQILKLVRGKSPKAKAR
jgi:TLC domain